MYGFIAGDESFRESEYPESTDPCDEDAGEWVVCPECGSENAGFMYWGEGVDTDFKCPDCGERHGIR